MSVSADTNASERSKENFFGHAYESNNEIKFYCDFQFQSYSVFYVCFVLLCILIWYGCVVIIMYFYVYVSFATFKIPLEDITYIVYDTSIQVLH